MNILVCVKPVPDPDKYGDLKIDPETKRLVREGIPAIINPADRAAIEEALRLREQLGGKVTVLSMAPEFAKDRMTECLAMGADEAYLLSDAAFGGADTFATSYVLARVAERIEGPEGEEKFDLILFGNESADGATAHVPVQVAEWLRRPHLSRVCKIEQVGNVESGSDCAETGEEDLQINRLRAWKKGDGGKLLFEIKLPCVLALSGDINKPRFVNAMGLIKAKKKPLTVWSNQDLDLDAGHIGLDGSPTKAGVLITPDMRRQAEDLGSEADEIADRIIGLMKKAGV